MKLTYATVALLGFTQACSYTEQYWKNDPTCSGVPSYDQTAVGDEMNKCYYDEASEEEYGKITRCSGGVFTWANHGYDETCTALPGLYSFPSGACLFVENDGDDKWYGKVTITEEETAPINMLLDLL